MTRSSREFRALVARGVMVLAAILLLPLAATLQAPRESAAQQAAQDSLWAGRKGSVAACADPSSAAALAACFSTAPTGVTGQYDLAVATDGVNVYFVGESDGGLSCPIADLGANCTRIMAGPWPPQACQFECEPVALAAADGYLWIGQANGQIYRCPSNLPYVQQNTAPPQCLLLDDAGDRAVYSLLLANGTLYAGLSAYKQQGLLWSCSPDTVNSCSTLDSYGNTVAMSLAAGGGYLWAGLQNGLVWRCDLNAANACDNWEKAGDPVYSISYDGQGTLYAAIYTFYGVVWSCPTAYANGCSNVLSRIEPISVAAGPGNVFSSLNEASGSVLYYGSSAFEAASYRAWNESALLYLPADGPTGVGGAEITIGAGSPDTTLQKGCAGLGKKARATIVVEGPNGFEKTMKTSACGLAKGGSVTETVDLLDPGEYTVTVRAGKYAGEASFAIEPDRTRQVTVQLTRGLHH